MSITAILFDLDGTLLPLDQDALTQAYFKLLAARLAPHGYEPRQLLNGIWQGIEAMVQNDGSRTNEEAFWDKFVSLYGEGCLAHQPIFEDFYRNEFQQVAQACGFTPDAAHTVEQLKEMGFRLVLATNPLFPSIATESRIRWAGLNKDDFELYTTYENSRYCKPNLNYYREILQKLGLNAQECLMVGNDVGEDMIARELGMQVFLLTDCLINKQNTDLSVYPHGSFAQLMEYVVSLV